MTLLVQTHAAAADSYSSEDLFGRVHFSGEAAAGFFDTGSQGRFPNQEFVLDEAKLFVEAEIHEDIYVFGELNLMTREEGDEDLNIGEIYLEFENISKLWGHENLLGARFGRFDIPFGEEYLKRDAIDNPLISHSLSDIWGVDEGVEIYGSIPSIEYIFAVQNGGEPVLRDFNSDKAVAGRLRLKLKDAARFSVSAMRTGKIDVENDQFTELWFGNASLRAIGDPASTTTFEANLFQGNAGAEWTSGHIDAAAGRMWYDDNDTNEDNSRDANYYQVEIVQNAITTQKSHFYGAVRYSRVQSDRGIPLVANGSREPFLLDHELLTRELSRLSLGMGYGFRNKVVIKVEYSFERGELLNGAKRSDEDFLGIQAAVKF